MIMFMMVIIGDVDDDDHNQNDNHRGIDDDDDFRTHIDLHGLHLLLNSVHDASEVS